MLENGAAVAQVGLDPEQVVVGAADFIQPERHDLHQSQRTGMRDRKLIEAALHIDDRQHQFGGEFSAAGLLMGHAENLQAVPLASAIGVQPRGHVQQPDLGVETVFEAVSLGHGLHQRSADAWVRFQRLGQPGAGRPADCQGEQPADSPRAPRRDRGGLHGAPPAPRPACWGCRWLRRHHGPCTPVHHDPGCGHRRRCDAECR